ncbi:DUF4755 domain-containing protein, partial [Rouxiella silvae]|nr:DUF4755 domain-containing protein [Rouxiella silvae]
MTTELTFKEPAKPTVFVMKRVWVALAIPVLIFCTLGSEAVSQSLIAWLFAGAIIIFTAIPKYLDKRKNHSTIDYFNEKNDGYYYHEFDKTSLLIDLNEKTIKLKEKNKEQTYSLSDIKTWRYCKHTRFSSTHFLRFPYFRPSACTLPASGYSEIHEVARCYIP